LAVKQTDKLLVAPVRTKVADVPVVLEVLKLAKQLATDDVSEPL
jgi:hypothetical protein